MRKLQTFAVTLGINDKHQWVHQFIGYPTVTEVAAALRIDKSEQPSEQFCEMTDNLLQLLERFGLPLTLGEDTHCEFVGVRVGYIRVSESNAIYLSERVESELPRFEVPQPTQPAE